MKLEDDAFFALLGKHARQPVVTGQDVLFGAGLDLSSIAFLEFIMELEEEMDAEVDVDDLDASIITAGQLLARLRVQLG